MPNNHWNMQVDLLPETTDTFNLGSSQKKWIVNGYDLSDACEKDVDTSISKQSASTNLPTSKAVADLVREWMSAITVVDTTLVFGTDLTNISVSGTTLVIE